MTNPPALTPRRRRVLACIREHIAAHGYPPTLREIAAAVDLRSTSTVAYQIRELERHGYLTHAPGIPRSISLTTKEIS